MKKLAFAALITLVVFGNVLAGEGYSGGVDLSFYTAYPWRHQMSNTEGASHWMAYGDLDVWGPFSVGGYMWQNFDLTSNRSRKFKNALTETDYGVHLGYAAWKSEEGDMSLSFEAGHEWYLYHNTRLSREAYPDTSEMYLRGTFSNPFITPYAGVAWMYRDFGDYSAGFYYDIGFVKEIELFELLTVGADWNIGFADKDYQYFLVGTDSQGIFGTTFKLYAKLPVTEWMSLKGTIAYTGFVNGDVRDQVDENRDNLWGSVNLTVSF